MKTLGFGIKSLLKNPAWAAQHVGNYQRNNPIKPAENENDRYGQNKPYSVSGFGEQDGVSLRAKKGDIDFGGVNNRIPVQYGADGNVFSQSKIGAAEEKKNIFQMMNKFDELHKPLAASVMPVQNADPMSPLAEDDKLKKIGKKLNLFI